MLLIGLRRTICAFRSPTTRPIRRCYTALLSPSEYTEQEVSIPVGGNGLVTLNILQPIPATNAKQNVILYLPPGPLLDPNLRQSGDVTKTDASHATCELILASKTLSTVVTVNYRLGLHPTTIDPNNTLYYPTPIHDTVCGFDWVVANLLPPLSTKKQGWNSQQYTEVRSQEPRLCVYGEKIGGSLATMLALTEAKHIHALAVHEPIVDWVGLDDYLKDIDYLEAERVKESGVESGAESGVEPSAESRLLSELDSSITIAETKSNTFDVGRDAQRASQVSSRTKKAKVFPSDLEELTRIRSMIFKRPENWFDPFASPILFLRAPSWEAPMDWDRYWNFDERLQGAPIESVADSHEDKDLAALELGRQTVAFDGETGLPTPPATPPAEKPKFPEPQKRRRALRKWPPIVIGEMPSKLPMVRVFTSTDGTSEMANIEDTLPTSNARSGASASASAGAKASARSRSKSKYSRSPRPVPRILHSQAHELVSYMRKVCFWGIEKESGVSARRVNVVEMSDTVSSNTSSLTAAELAGDWIWNGAPEAEVADAVAHVEDVEEI